MLGREKFVCRLSAIVGFGSGSANRTVAGEGLLSILISKDCFDFRLDFMEDRFGTLDVDLEETLDSLLNEDRMEFGVVMPLDAMEWPSIF
jgi:hypothetical protein